MKKQDLSIIIPVYNGQDYIGRCLESVLNQRDIDKYEIIVVNDGSTDETRNILGQFANENKNLHIINQKNGGVSVARNNGIRASHGKYITFIDCDDMVGLNASALDKYFPQSSLRRTIGNMSISTIHSIIPLINSVHFDDKYFTNMLHAVYDTNADVVLGGKITINYDEIYTRRHIYTSDKLYGTTQEDKDTILRQADIRENANFALYRRDMLDAHNLRFLVNMHLDEDMLFCMLATLYAQRVATVHDVLYFYNRHSDTLSNITNQDEKEQKYKTANIQLFSVLLTELHKQPKYAKIFTTWIKEYSHKGERYSFDTGEFPPMDCYQFCDQHECTGCFIAEAMCENCKKNIAKYLRYHEK